MSNDGINIGTDSDPITAALTAARLYALDTEAGEHVSANAAGIMLSRVAMLREELDRVEMRLTEAILDAGGSWDDVAAHTGRSARQGAQRRYRRLGGTRTWPTRRPESAAYAPVDHPGIAIPHGWGAWEVAWAEYDPVDITPAELRPEDLEQGAPAWVVDTQANPEEIADWGQRQHDAVVPFEVTDGWPLHPHGRTGRAGRNLPRWGENAAADPIVLAGTGRERHVLLIERSDGAGWAIPGGMVDPGETAPAALTRELAEETGVDLTAHTPTILSQQLVDDWRQTDHAWVASTAALFQLPEQAVATAGDDALAARWVPAADLETVERSVQQAGGTLYAAHRPLLARALEHAA